MTWMAHEEPAGALPQISTREAEVLAGLAEHLTNAEIAARMFISVRTVESHVSSLLRKTGATDRRGLIAVAAPRPEADGASRPPGRGWPAPLTPFVGRAAERAALVAALGAHRLVTAVGPGGVGKTRLAQVVADQVRGRYRDGAAYVDLVPVTDPAMVVAAVADAFGLGEQRGRSAHETVLGALADREALLVLDNCEHVLDGVLGVLEPLLARCPGLVVLATSRARLLVPYEWVFRVPGLSVGEGEGGGEEGDAVELFLARAAAAGSAPDGLDRRRVAAVCRGLDGMSLAIELAAARLPTLGLDGLESGLADRLSLLTGGRRIDDRHRSLRSALDWSWRLLHEPEQAVVRRTSVFVTPFTPADAEAVVGNWPPVGGTGVPAHLAALVDASLLVATPGANGTRYSALETVRQYASERLSEAGERDDVHARHIGWCAARGAALGAAQHKESAAWRSGFDSVADELRAALGRAAAATGFRERAHQLALSLAGLSFLRGLPGESQHRYEQAAALAGTRAAAADALRLAAGAAETRHFGDDALRLHRSAAAAALEAGDRPTAAGERARMAELVKRGSGLIRNLPTDEEVARLLAEAAELADGDPVATAKVATARAFAWDATRPDAGEVTEEAIRLARAASAAVVECAAADQAMSIELAHGRVATAVTVTRRRAALLETLPIAADTGLEFSDGFNMATDVAVAAGDLAAARTFAERVRSLPFQREETHLATARLIVVTALTGDWDETEDLAGQYRAGWERVGRPHDGDLNRGAYAAATVFGLRGDDAAHGQWLQIVGELLTPSLADRDRRCYETFDALLHLHRGRADAAWAGLSIPPEECATWHGGLWRPWHAALWAEAAVLAGRPGADDCVLRAGAVAKDNPVAAAIVRRAAALAADDRPGLLTAAAAMQAAGCRYQWARTLILAGGPERARGEQALAAVGAAAMVP